MTSRDVQVTHILANYNCQNRLQN